MKTFTPLRQQQGFTLIEVLVAVLIFSFGLLGFVGLQARAIQFSTSGEDTNRAALLANELATAIVTTGNGAASIPSTSSFSYTAWQSRVATPASGGLPNGSGSLSNPATNTATITITWVPTTAATGTTPNQYVTQVIVP